MSLKLVLFYGSVRSQRQGIAAALAGRDHRAGGGQLGCPEVPGMQVERHLEEALPARQFGQPVGLARGRPFGQGQAAGLGKDRAEVDRLDPDLDTVP